jgi:hypothetical protein
MEPEEEKKDGEEMMPDGMEGTMPAGNPEVGANPTEEEETEM